VTLGAIAVPSDVELKQARCQGENGCFADAAHASVGVECGAAEQADGFE